MLECLLSMPSALGLIPWYHSQHTMLAHVCDPFIRKAETGRLGVHGLLSYTINSRMS